MDLIQPKDITIADEEGKERTFTLSKFPAVQGREIDFKYKLAHAAETRNYDVSEEVMLKLMSYVAVNNGTLRLTTMALVNNHCGNPETLDKLELEMLRYNFRFFRNATLSGS